MARRIRKGDLVAVMSGDDEGKRGRVLRILPANGRVIVEGVNLVFKHLRPSQNHPQGGRIRREAPIDASNVMPIDPETNKPTRVRRKIDERGRKIRVAAKSGASLVGAATGRRGAARKGASETATGAKARAANESTQTEGDGE